MSTAIIVGHGVEDAGTAEVDAADEIDPTPIRGQWYWLSKPRKGWGHYYMDGVDGPILVCCTHLGSNYAEVVRHHGHTSWRIHADDYAKRLTHAPDASEYIERMVSECREDVRELMGQVRELTARLGVGESVGLPAGGGDTMALSTTKGDLGAYKAELIAAKEKQLPELFEAIELANKRMAAWMTAKSRPLMAEAQSMQSAIEVISARVGSVELYAGIVEQITQIADGTPADISEPIHLFQRRLYMDEECLVAYEAGGMEFANLGEFDAWLAKPINRDRILPHPRCIVTFRVRRNEKERHGDTLSDFIKINSKADQDKSTFLYIRNGERLYGLRTAVQFDSDLFPDIEQQDLTGKLWMKDDGKKIISDNRYQGLVEDDKRTIEDYKAYRKLTKKQRDEHPRNHDFWIRRPDLEAEGYEPYDQRSVYYDDAERTLQNLATKHNRLVLVLQGLLDRSLVLHPHPEWKLWSAEGFAAALRLVYDNGRTIVSGPAPDFDAYHEHCNRSIKAGSVVAGAHVPWMEKMAEVESDRLDRRGVSYREITRHTPWGNPGPGWIARVSHVSRDRKTATFEWMRQRAKPEWVPCKDKPGYVEKSWDRKLKTTFTCDTSLLFNLDAYQPGDFHRFFDDARTRADYLQWAPLLLVGEDYKAGKRKPDRDADEKPARTETVDDESDMETE